MEHRTIGSELRSGYSRKLVKTNDIFDISLGSRLASQQQTCKKRSVLFKLVHLSICVKLHLLSNFAPCTQLLFFIGDQTRSFPDLIRSLTKSLNSSTLILLWLQGSSFVQYNSFSCKIKEVIAFFFKWICKRFQCLCQGCHMLFFARMVCCRHGVVLSWCS